MFARFNCSWDTVRRNHSYNLSQERIAHWREQLTLHGRVASEGQAELRAMLREFDGDAKEIRHAIGMLLNPQDLEKIELSDDELSREYRIVTEDNYRDMSSRSRQTRVRFYDSAHGKIVAREIKPFD